LRPRVHILIRLTCLIASVLATAPAASAMETDQFTTPRAPLYDIGPRLSRKIADIIESDRTGRDPERVLSEWVGSNIFVSRLVSWVKQIRVEDRTVGFLPSVFRSIYGRTLSPVPFSFQFDSPTVNVHGFYLGTDKIDHFFQQGHEYFDEVKHAQANGTDEAAAIAEAVARGVKQEHTYYGTLVSGIYSNADLAANYAGMKFYTNLRQPVRIGDRVGPPLLEPSPGGWRFRAGVDRDRLLQAFFSDHLDESLNPSRYRFSRESIRSRVRDRCDAWMRFYADRLGKVARSGQSFSSTWFGESYGHWLPPEDEVSIATECAPALHSGVSGPAPTRATG
jgi:hypothetical protein